MIDCFGCGRDLDIGDHGISFSYVIGQDLYDENNIINNQRIALSRGIKTLCFGCYGKLDEKLLKRHLMEVFSNILPDQIERWLNKKSSYNNCDNCHISMDRDEIYMRIYKTHEVYKKDDIEHFCIEPLEEKVFINSCAICSTGFLIEDLHLEKDLFF